MYYSAIGLIALFTLLIVNQDILLKPKESYNKPVWKIYRMFLVAVLVYYITDILWGIFEGKKLVILLFIDTTVYFIAMSFGILLWAQYTVAYLGERNFFRGFIVYAGRFIAGLITILVIVNIFAPILFEIDEDCNYHALPIRYAVLTCQILMFILISVYAVSSIFRLDKEDAKVQKFKILASFGIIMAVLLFIQLLFPLLPVYSIGYMLGTCMLHTFIANDEKEDYKRGLEETKKITMLKDIMFSLLDNMPGMTFTKDSETGVYLACNQAFAEYAHKNNSSEVIGLTDAEIFDAETAAHFVKDDKIALSLSKPYVFFEDVPDAAGNQRQLQTTKLKYTDTTGRVCVLGMCQDVTDMVRIQHEHAMTKEAYESAVSSGLMYTNIAQTLARDYIEMYYVNKDSEEFIEYSNSEENGTFFEKRRGWHFFSDCKKELAENVYPDDREAFLQAMNRKTLMQTLKNKNTFAMTYRKLGDDGPFYVNMKISLMEDEKFIIIGVTDVDAEIRETMAKHDVLVPLKELISLDKVALESDKLDDETRQYLEKIGDNLDQILSLINDTLEDR